MDYLFVDRMRRLIATVPTDSVDGLCISSDDEIVTINGSRNLTLELTYSADTVLLAAKTGAIGNLVMYKDEDKNPVVMEIVKSVRDPLNYTYTLSADTAGADLIDETVDTYDADDEYTIDYYVDKFTWDSGWEIRLNQVTEKALKLKYDNEDETALARALNVASDFGAELDFAFTIDTDHTVHKYIDIYAARGSQTNAELVRDINVNNVTSTTDIYDMFTSVKAKSDVNDKDGNPITLKGMTWQSDDGRYVLGSDGILRDTVAVHKWSRILSEDNPDPSTHHLQRVKKYTTGLDTASDDNPKYKQYPDKVEAKNKDIASQKKKITATDAYIKSQNGYIAKKQKYIAECNARIAAYEKKQKYTYPAKKAAYLVKVKSLQAELAKGGTASHVKSLANQIATQQRLAANQDKYAAKQSKYIAKQQAYIKAANAAIKGYKKKIADYNAKIKGYNATIDKDNSDITDLNAGKVALYNDVQSKTLDLALADLKAHNEPAVNYETDIALLPDTVRLGDTVHIVDDEEGTYLSSRVLQIETSRAAGTRVATMGNYLIEQRQAENADAALAQKIDYATQGLQKDSAQGKKFQAEIDERLANADTEAAQLEQKLTDNKAYYDKEVSDLNAAVATAQQAAIDTAKTDLETTMGTYKGEVDKQFKEYNDGYDLKLTEADGRISTLTDSIDGFQAKVEDTVTGISSKFDVLSDSVNATISKDNLQALFAVQIQDGTASIVDRLTDAEGNIEATTKLANGIQQSVESLTTNTSTQINQLSDLIDLRATSADVKAQIDVATKGLNASIESVDGKTVNLGATIDDITGWQATVDDSVSGLKNQMTSTTDTWNQKLTDAKNSLTTQISSSVANGLASIDLKANGGYLSIAGNGSTSKVWLGGDNLYLTGDTHVEGDFFLTEVNNSLDSLKLDTSGMFLKQGGDDIGWIHTNNLVDHEQYDGLLFDLKAKGDYMAWGAQNANGPDGDYPIKLAWWRSDVAKAIGDDTVAGFQFSDPVQFDKNIHIPNANGELSFAKTNLSGNATTSPYPYFGRASGNAGFAYGSSAVYMVQGGNWSRVVNTHDPFKPDGGAYQNLQFTTMVSNNTYYPALTNQEGKVGILFGSTELYLMRDGKPYPLSGILK